MPVAMVLGGLIYLGLWLLASRALPRCEGVGWFALLPGAVQLINVVLAPRLMRQMMDNMSQMQLGDPTAPMRAMQGSMGAASLLGWVAIIAIIVMGVRKSTPGPNRFGEAPFSA